jgi:hypothetical protein
METRATCISSPIGDQTHEELDQLEAGGLPDRDIDEAKGNRPFPDGFQG